MNNELKINSAVTVENLLWNVLEMDDFSAEIVHNSFPDGQVFKMGTGHTVNACNMCTNSASTAGCGTCR